MGIIDRIIATKKKELETLRIEKPVSVLTSSPFFNSDVPSFRSALLKPVPAVIAEFKRSSPSKGTINILSRVRDVVKGYEDAGASAVSVLTDRDYFSGSVDDLSEAAAILRIPLLRKDFIIDEYQVIEAKSAGASAILLIGNILDRKMSKSLTRLAHDLGMQVLFEIHDISDLDVMDASINIIGVNNRNLDTLSVSIEICSDLLRQLPANSIKVAESGFESPEDVKRMFTYGYNAFLIGTFFLSAPDPASKAADFIYEMKK